MKCYIKTILFLNLLFTVAILEPSKKQTKDHGGRFPLRQKTTDTLDGLSNETKFDDENNSKAINIIEKAIEIIDANDFDDFLQFSSKYPELFNEAAMLLEHAVELKADNRIITMLQSMIELSASPTRSNQSPPTATPNRPTSAESFRTRSTIPSIYRLTSVSDNLDTSETPAAALPSFNQSFVSTPSNQSSPAAKNLSPKSAQTLEKIKAKIAPLLHNPQELIKQISSLIDELPDKIYNPTIKFKENLVVCNIQHIYWGDIDTNTIRFTGGHTMKSIQRLEFLGLVSPQWYRSSEKNIGTKCFVIHNNITNRYYEIAIFPDSWGPLDICKKISEMKITKETNDPKTDPNIVIIRGKTKEENIELEIVFNKKDKIIITAYPAIYPCLSSSL